MPLGRPSAKKPDFPWWRRFPRPENRRYRAMPATASPTLDVGAVVLLKGKPDRARRVLEAAWHGHRHEFVYVIETSAPDGFKPYWFLDQLESLDSLSD